MRAPISCFALLGIVTLLCGGGCSSSGDKDPGLDAGTDSAPLEDSAPADVAGEVAASDAPITGCTLVAPRLGGTAELDALAKAPARCGQPAHSWLASPDLGEVISVHESQEIIAAVARMLLAAAKLDAPETVPDAVTEQIAYQTQDRGALHEATALLAYPVGLPQDAELDVLLLLHGTSGFTDGCSPASDMMRKQLAALAALGYIVVHPDYIGMRSFGEPTGFLHPYTAGQPTAIAALDAVRAAARRVAQVTSAAQAEDPTAARVCATTRFVAVGGSQGGHAALWIDRLHPYYAPELELAGAAAIVPSSAVYEHVVRALRDMVPATKNTVAFYGATSEWYGAGDRRAEAFAPPADTDVPTTLAAECDPEVLVQDKTLADLFQPAFLAAAAKEGDAGLISLDPWGCMATENSLVRTSVVRQKPTAASYGILFVLGEADTLVDPVIERKAFDDLCAQGMKMQYLECAGATHTGAQTASLPEVLDFLRDRLAGKPLDTTVTCKRGPATACRGAQ